MENSPSAKKTLKILHLEDSIIEAELIQDRLELPGYDFQTDWAVDQAAFMAFLKNSHYDLVLADYQLPGFDAKAALEMTKTLLPGIPFICISGAIGEERAVELLKLGATDYVSKDRLEKLPLVIHRALNEIAERRGHRLSQLALQDSQNRHRAIIKTAMSGFMIMDVGGDIQEVNEAYSRMTGYSETELLGMNISSLETKALFDNIEERRRRIAEGIEDRFESKHRRKDGSLFDVEVSVQYRADEGGYIIAFIADITERMQNQQTLQDLNLQLEDRVRERTKELMETIEQSRKLQEALVIKEKLASLTPLVAAVSHELNTPIGNIVVLGSALDERCKVIAAKLPEQLTQTEFREFISYLERTNELLLSCASSAASIIQSFKKVAADRQGENKHNFNLHELVSDCFCLVALNFKTAHHNLINEVPDQLNLVNYPGAVGQVIENLLRNAFIHAFTPDSHGHIKVSATTSGPDDRWVTLVVEDDGVGIPAADRPKIFDPFFTTQLGSGGSGLGLSIVYNIVSRILGGSIAVSSICSQESLPETPSGSSFIIRIPRDIGSE